MSDTTAITLTLYRGLQLLREFRGTRSHLTSAELARRTGLSTSSVSRLTGTLVKLGYLRRVPWGGGLQLGSRGFDIGRAYSSSRLFTLLADPILQEVAEELNANMALSIPDQSDMLYVACRTSRNIRTLRVQVGSLIPMTLTAAGRAWLWAADAHAREQYLSRILCRQSKHNVDIQQRIERAFQELHQTGVTTVFGEYQAGACAVGMPVKLGKNDLLMALNCGFAISEKDLNWERIRDRVIPRLKSSADQLIHCFKEHEIHL